MHTGLSVTSSELGAASSAESKQMSKAQRVSSRTSQSKEMTPTSTQGPQHERRAHVTCSVPYVNPEISSQHSQKPTRMEHTSWMTAPSLLPIRERLRGPDGHEDAMAFPVASPSPLGDVLIHSEHIFPPDCDDTEVMLIAKSHKKVFLGFLHFY